MGLPCSRTCGPGCRQPSRVTDHVATPSRLVTTQNGNHVSKHPLSRDRSSPTPQPNLPSGTSSGPAAVGSSADAGTQSLPPAAARKCFNCRRMTKAPPDTFRPGGVRPDQSVVGSLRGVPVVDENSRAVENAGLQVLQRLLRS
jgi:hypothetical protein